MRKIIVASHGDFSKGIKDSALLIAGEAAKEVETYSLYPGAAASDFAAELEERIKADPDNEYVIVADLYGASVCTAMVPLANYENVCLFSGLNLAILLELLLGDQEKLSKETALELEHTAREGIKWICMEDLDQDDNSF